MHHVRSNLFDNRPTNDGQMRKLSPFYNFRMNENSDFYIKKTILIPHLSSFRAQGVYLQFCHVPKARVIFDRMSDAGCFTEKYLGPGHASQTCMSIEDKFLHILLTKPTVFSRYIKLLSATNIRVTFSLSEWIHD